MKYDSVERLDEILRRAERIREMESIRKRIAVDAVASGVCTVALVFLIIAMTGRDAVHTEGENWRYGGMLLYGEMGRYVMVAVVSMALGVLTVCLIRRVRRLREMDRENRRP